MTIYAYYPIKGTEQALHTTENNSVVMQYDHLTGVTHIMGNYGVPLCGRSMKEYSLILPQDAPDVERYVDCKNCVTKAIKRKWLIRAEQEE